MKNLHAQDPSSPRAGSCVLEGNRMIDRELVIERAVPGCLPDRSFQRGPGTRPGSLLFGVTVFRRVISGAQLLASEHSRHRINDVYNVKLQLNLN